ncbi:MAG: AAA family ATPase [Lachnospiraceae bacterium]|nr:AAA family ATPase [Lachnospiraceae bacterium]
MGIYINPGNAGFQGIRNDEYVDKSGLIALINESIDTPRRLTCVSRPRRFGKSFAAKMLCAYYDKTCDSSGLFDDLSIAGDEQYRHYLNKYDVIYLDMTNIIGEAGQDGIVSFIKRKVTEELLKIYPDMEADEESFSATLNNAVELTGSKFIVIIDEWDAPIRENPSNQREYLEFLRAMFKSSGTTDKLFAAAYMTGILPIKKDGSQSAISDFEEFTMVKPRKYGSYVGFTEAEVRVLCHKYNVDFTRMKQWYDGYEFRDIGAMYNPNSVMKAIRNDDFDSYWTETSAAISLMEYISLDFDGLSKTIVELMGGISIKVETKGFSNDLITFRNKDDVLTALIHLGYLAYDEETQTVRIPNEELRREFARSIRQVKRDETIRRVRESDRLIYDTVHGNAEAVAEQIEKVHAEETAVLFYNDEQALRSVIKIAYFSYKDHYLKFEELPGGDGYVDIVYLPKKGSMLPALVIEMKWNKSAKGAIAQIKDKNYPDAIKDYGTEVLLVGINYDKQAPAGKRKHECIIEKMI